MERISQINIKNLQEYIKQLPTTCGCYLMKNHKGEVIYVGKAKNLKSRVSSYFQNQKVIDSKTLSLVQNIHSIEFILASNEAKALVMENSLIKSLSPRYNIRLKDDRVYPLVVLDMNHSYPHFKILRRLKKNQSRKNIWIFGPFSVSAGLQTLVDRINKVLLLRSCSDQVFKSTKFACLLKEINQCSAPCIHKDNQADYLKKVLQGKSFFENKMSAFILQIESEMLALSHEMRFEEAAFFRDTLKSLTYFQDFHQSLVNHYPKVEALDIWVVYETSDSQHIHILKQLIRHENVIGQNHYTFSREQFFSGLSELLEKIVIDHYLKNRDHWPKEILIDLDASRLNLLEALFESIWHDELKMDKEFHLKLMSFSQTRGVLLEAVHKAKETAKELWRIEEKLPENIFHALSELQKILGMTSVPRRIECFDTAVLQGQSPTAAMVVYHDGVKQPDLYRYVHLETYVGGNNDFLFMREVLSRRVKKGYLPDLWVIDGGKGQWSEAYKVLESLNIQTEVQIVALAKKKARQATQERIFLSNQGEAYVLPIGSPVYKLLTQMRDEAHRFCRKLHHKDRSKKFFDH